MSEFTFSGITLQNGKLLYSNSCQKFHAYMLLLGSIHMSKSLITIFLVSQARTLLSFFPIWDFFSFPFLFVIIITIFLLKVRGTSICFTLCLLLIFQQKMQGSWIVRQSVGSTPCLLGKAVDCNYIRGPKYLEVIFH